MNKIEKYVNNLNVNDKYCYEKWSPIIELYLDIKNVKVINTISVFLEKYSIYLDNNKNNNIRLENFIVNVSNRLNDHEKNIDFRIPIKHKFINIKNGKKGYELINGIIFEDSKIIENDASNNYFHEINNIIDDEILLTINPDIKNVKIRKTKMDTLNKH